ncbi:MAG: hypothetical protein N3D10_01620, partial [Candidatus Micrarchaeota archaeon]|nr:hypothetical protein [Candidatus Micrarchaeota archaeon]
MNKKLILAVMFLLLLLSGCVSLGGQNKEAQKSVMEKFSKWYLKWSRPIHLAIAILIAILAIAWMYGQIFQKEDVKVWVKAEIANLIYTIMILFFIFILLESASFVVNVLPTYTPIPKTE